MEITGRSSFRPSDRDRARFWAKVRKTDDCWLWTAATHKQRENYGAFRFAGRTRQAHRWIFEVLAGMELPPHLDVCHSCDNPRCVHPGHLFLGPATVNMQDASAKGRLIRSDEFRARFQGERHHQAKLAEADVRRVAELRAQGWPMHRIGAEIGISRQHVARILKGESWAHLSGGRSKPSKGTGEGHRTKLSEQQAREIIAKHAEGFTCRQLGKRYGISNRSVSDIVRGVTWKHLPRPA